MKAVGICTLIICGLFYFSEGKPCPEKTRPHKTRCEAYYKCMELPSRKHVWIPEKCEQGLIYEPNLKLCVLPGDDWECTLGENPLEKFNKQPTNNNNENHQFATADRHTSDIKETDIYIVNTDSEDNLPLKQKPNENNIELILRDSLSSEEENDENSETEGSGDGGELVELDGFLQAENKETVDHILEKPIEEHESALMQTSSPTSNIDPKLTEHLQRLSQLIDGLKQSYQSGGEPQKELRPDQLNAFLAHFNIKNKFNLINTNVDSITTNPATTTPTPESTTTIDLLKMAPKNKTLLQEHLSHKLEPETKVVLTNSLPKRYGNVGYSSSQIVVNRPEGSVLFTLPSAYGAEQHFAEHTAEYSHNSPKISEDTLKTVLELSKQMIATQNMPKVIPNPAYYPQPILQPLFIPASAFPQQSHASPFSSYFNNNNNNNNNEDYDYNDGKYGPLPSTFGKLHGHKKPQRPGSGHTKPGTTIIHNNVIPVHVTSTNSGEKELVDSYGQSVGLYPPLQLDESGNSNNNNGYQPQTINHHHIHSHRFDNNNNKFLASVTTMRPSVSTTSSSVYMGQYASPYPSELTATTARPFDFQTTPTTISEYYTPSPHLSENNVNSLFPPPDRYPTIQYGNIPRPIDRNRPSSAQPVSAQYYQQPNPNALFPQQIDTNKVKIRPNAHKVESMEDEDDDIASTYNDNQQQQQQQMLSYNYSNKKPELSTHYVDPLLSFTSSASHKRPYMPRPQGGTTSAGASYSGSANKPKFPSFGVHSQTAHSDGTQLVNVGGNFISYDVFQNTIMPLLGPSQSLNDLNNVEVITCAAGVRQPNITDCTRYYVCSKKDGKVLSYSCPPYTAFNAQTRICDARTYSVCTPEAIASSYTVSENKRIQLEAMKALQDAKRRQEQAMKAQSIANMLQQYGGQVDAPNTEEQGDSSEKDMLNAYVQQAAAMSVFSTTAKPSAAPVKKRKYYCKEGDKIADQTSINSYFVCYKNAQGMMKGHKMTCSKGLLFCPKTSMCTLASKCS